MPTEPKSIKGTRHGERAHLLEKAATTSLLLEQDGVVYRLARTQRETGWAGDDPERVVDAVERTAGSWQTLTPMP